MKFTTPPQLSGLGRQGYRARGGVGGVGGVVLKILGWRRRSGVAGGLLYIIILLPINIYSLTPPTPPLPLRS